MKIGPSDAFKVTYSIETPSSTNMLSGFIILFVDDNLEEFLFVVINLKSCLITLGLILNKSVRDFILNKLSE